MVGGVVVEHAVVIVIKAFPFSNISNRYYKCSRLPIDVESNAPHIDLLPTLSAHPKKDRLSLLSPPLM